jgi:hypothetical protein
VLIRDRDSRFGTESDGANALLAAQFGRRHLVHILRAYSCGYLNTSRPHQGIRQRTPIPSEIKKFTEGAIVRSLPGLGGLQHDYLVAAVRTRMPEVAKTATYCTWVLNRDASQDQGED